VRWEVVAPDAHPIEGTFSFTVRSAVEVAEQPAAPSIQPDAAGDVSAAVAEELEAFLAPSQQPASPGRVAAAARFVGLTGAVVAIGGLVFTAMVLRGEQREIAYVLRWVHVAALLVVVGAISELFAQGVVARGGDWGSIGSVDEIRNTVRSDFGVATGLRLLGAGLIIAGMRAKAASPASAADPGHVLRSWLRAGAAAAIGRPPGQASSTPHSPAPSHGEVWTWNVTTTATVGVVAVVAAPVFDGHTVTEGSRPLTAIADAVHVAASAVWAGGAGVALTASILDSPAQLWSSDWGRVLMAKSLLVMVAAVMGAYHHWVVLPAMEAAPDNAELVQRFRSTVAVEAVIFVGVVGVTAGLIGAAT